MTWRKSHGNAAACGRLTVLECPPADELPSASPAEPVGAERDAHGHFARGNRIGLARRLRCGPRGGITPLEQQADPAWKVAARWGRRYASHRRAELARAHGGVISAGVGAIVESAGALLADARYWRAKGMAEGNADYSRLAAQLTTAARQAERDAWELASREAAARPKPATRRTEITPEEYLRLNPSLRESQS